MAPSANDDRKPSIVTIKRKSRFGAPDLTPEALQRRGEAADALWRELVRRAGDRQGPAVTHGLPTSRTTLRARYVSLLVWCKGGCQHQADADLHRLVESGRGDVPLVPLRVGGAACSPHRDAGSIARAASRRGRSAPIPAGLLDAAGELRQAPEAKRQVRDAYAAPGTAGGGDSVAGVDRFLAQVVRRAAWQ